LEEGIDESQFPFGARYCGLTRRKLNCLIQNEGNIAEKKGGSRSEMTLSSQL
jgi:hypothetical protein